MSVSKAARVEMAVIVTENAVRWASNILVEVLSNHGRFLTDERRDAVKEACSALNRFGMCARELEVKS